MLFIHSFIFFFHVPDMTSFCKIMLFYTESRETSTSIALKAVSGDLQGRRCKGVVCWYDPKDDVDFCWGSGVFGSVRVGGPWINGSLKAFGP